MGQRYRPPGPKSSTYITPQGMKKLQDEMIYLWQVERPKVTQQVQDAAAQGDRSENADYIYGKRRLREIDSRLEFLSKRVDVLKVVDSNPDNPQKVYFGAWVTLEDEDGETAEYRIVGPDETDGKARWISMDSPVAKALLGRKIGDECVVKRPKGDAHMTIISVRYQ